MMILYTLMTELPTAVVENQLEKITNPILGLLLIVLGGLVWFLMKQNSAKDLYIKELNSSLLEHSVNSLEVIKNLENSIKLDNASHEVLKELLKENNVFLQNIISDIAKFR